MNRPASVMITKTSGLAGIAYWINKHYALVGDHQVNKQDEWVIAVKADVDALYADGRTTLMGDLELEEIIAKYHPELVPDELEAGV